jgi:hypothetical protein
MGGMMVTNNSNEQLIKDLVMKPVDEMLEEEFADWVYACGDDEDFDNLDEETIEEIKRIREKVSGAFDRKWTAVEKEEQGSDKRRRPLLITRKESTTL